MKLGHKDGIGHLFIDGGDDGTICFGLSAKHETVEVEIHPNTY